MIARTADEVRVAVVTGAAQGIGRAIAVALARDGYRLVVVDRDAPTLAATSQELRSVGENGVLEIVGDLTDWDGPPEWIVRAEREYGRINVLVNNAALFEYGKDFHEISEHEFDRMQSVNVKGLFRITQCAVASMLKSGGGRIVSLASAAALAGSEMKAAHYATSKGAVVSLSRSLAREYGRRGLRANVVSPGAVDTEMTRAFGEAERSVYANSNPLGRMAAAEEIAEVVAFLASERSSFVNGQTISVCGGAITY